MISPNKPHGRAPQILKLLAEHGPLSARGLTDIMIPKTDTTRVREAMQRLQKRKLVVKMFDNLFSNRGVFYKINPNEKHWLEISEIVGCAPEYLFQPHFRKTELLHSERCGVWAEQLKRLLPGASIIRDHNFSSSEIAKEKLRSNGEERELIPDIIILKKSDVLGGTISVGVEVEKTVKSGSRLVRKLRKFCNESRLDGLVYVCEDASIAKRVRQIYLDRIIKRALTINNYGNNFLLFQNTLDASNLSHSTTYNSALRPAKLSTWFEHLSRHRLEERHDSNFDVQLAATGHFSMH